MEKELKNLLQDESEDAILARIQEESLRYYNEVELPRRAAENIENKEVTDHIQPQPHCSKNNDARFYNEVESPHRVAEEFQENGISDCEKLKTDQPHCSKTDGISQNTPVKDVFYKGCSQGADGFHLAAGETYVYPTNYPIRKYQKSIIHSALFHNTLVSLPTGLGKTFIAAVVMYNYYRWFPQGKIVFMAPTRPLVAQQIRACHDIMAIPIKDTIEMTGSMNPGDRLKQWKSKRVFFLTPQVMANDLRSGVCPATLFKCVVIDEAHRATKEYSYCHVIKELEKAGAMFRILALSATPGSNIKAVVEVVQNLRISTLELRGEDSPDVTPYTHAKQIEPVSLSLSKNILDFREQFLLIFERYARSLREARLVTCNVQNITKFQLLKASERIRSKPPNGMAKARVGILMADFTVCMTLAHGLELLQTYGLRAFHQYFTGCEDEENRKAAFTRLSQDVEFHQLMENLHKAVSSPMDQFWSHPKHEHLVKILKEHFSVNENQKEDSKVIIFCQYRVVVSEVYELLQKIHPSIKPIMFIGQGAGKDKTGLPQKKQIEVMKQFREGKSNVLIATCVAEEGLDIGSVDLLILMEVQRSPVRLVQRLGRTGRHRQGRCVVLLTQGREVQKFDEAMATKKSFISMIQNSKLLTANLFKDEPTMVPSHLMPKMQLVHINVPERITPGKVKKQSDIRQALMAKLNETEEAEESPFLLPEQEALVKEELNTLKVNFNSLSFTESKYLYHRINDANMGSEELFNLEFTQQSEFTDWNRVLQQTYLVSHSSDSEILCHLLDKAESMQLGEHKDLNSQVDYSSIVTNKKRVSKTKTKRVPENPIKKKKTDKEEKHGMDIRECMAIAADKARLTQDKCGVKDDSVIISESLIDQTVVISPQETIVQDKEHGDSVECASCNHTFGGIAKELQKFLPPIQNFSFNFNLSRMEIFVKSLTKEVITRFNVSETLRQDTDFTVEDINRNIMALKASNNVNITTKQESSDLFDVNDIFETEFQTPPKTLLPKSNLINHSLNKINSLARTPSKILVKPLLSQQSQDYFNLDDIFAGDDDEDIQHWVKCSKTSTPIQKITPVFDLESKKDGFEKGVFEERVQNPNKLKANTSMCLFKVPQMKLDPQTLNNLHDISKSSEVQLSPQSPVLSGQLVPPKISLTSVSAQGCRNSFFQSPESPILTGQLTLSSKMSSARREERKPLFCDSPESPILSSQILRNKSSPVNKAGRKVLFSENHVNKQKGDITKSTWCKPLYNNLNEMETNDVCTEIEGDDMLSASQLFDDEDSGEGNTKSNLDQSSMYTISQMVAKVTELARNPLVHESTAHKSTKDAKTPQKVDNKFGSSDEDSLFENINLDDLSVRNNNADTKKDVSNTEKILSNNMRNSGNVSYNCSTVNVNNKNVKENSNAETTLYKNNQLHNSINRSNSIISNQQNSALTNFEEVNEVCEESSITTRWLSCMKSPFQPHTIKTSTPHVQVNKKTNFDSDSDSHDDVFQSPLQKMKNRPPVNIEKNTRKEKKRQLFVEMEADVTGPPQSSDEENTSGLDDLDDSFINDMTEQPCTSVDHTVLDMQARYLQSVKSPVRKPGGFKIPKVSDSVLAQDVFSQFVEEEEDSYLNDSFCCDATEIPVDEEPSVLEMAEYILNQDRKSRKVKKTKRKRTKFNSSSDDNEIDQEQKEKWLLSSESSDEDQVVKNCKTRKRKQCVNSESSPSDQSLETKKPFKRKRIHLLTSDSDSDRTL